MTDPNTPADPECEDAREAVDMGEKPDLGHKADTLIEALEGTDMGSDTRAGSLRGGSASGSEIDPDSARINQALAEEGRSFAKRTEASDADPDGVEASPSRVAGESDDPTHGARGAD